MPPPRIAHWAREPRLTALAPKPQQQKDVGGYGIAFSALGLGAWGMLPSSTGVPVTPFTCMGIGAAYACINRLSQDQAKLPRKVWSLLPDGGMRLEPRHPVMALLRRPNRWQTSAQFFGYLTAWYAMRGNAYCLALRDANGEVFALLPISPDRCVPLISPDTGDLYYEISHSMLFQGVTRRYHRDDVIHLRNLISFDGHIGISPIAVAQDLFAMGLATQQHGATLFRQGAQLNGFLKHPGKLARETKEYLQDQFERRNAGVQNAHKTAVLDEGMSFEKVAMTNEDAQFLQSRQFTVPEVCRMFGVPPHKVFDLSDAHFNNLQQSELAYRSDTLLPIGVQFREEFGRVLLFEDEQATLVIDVDYDELLRADKLTRYQTYQIGLMNGIINRNEARIDDGRAPVEGGDEFRVPLNTGAPGDGPSAQAAAPDLSNIFAPPKPEPAEQGA